MKTKSTQRICLITSLSLFFSIFLFYPQISKAETVFLYLNPTRVSIAIGEEFQLTGFTTNGAMPKFKSSSSKIASVTPYGTITGKQAGTAKITASVKGASASCTVTVKKTIISVNTRQVTLERGETCQINATASNNSPISWKSNRKSTAYVDENGLITAGRPGEAMITAKADRSEERIRVVVKKPAITLNQSSKKLYRGETFQIKASVSSGITPIYRSSKKSVALVDENGLVTAIKHGTALITVTADGVAKVCEITVKSPEIRLDDEITIKKGEKFQLKFFVSSGNSPQFKSSNTNVASVTETGELTALKKGRAYIYVSEDGTKERCTVYVKET